MKEAMRVFQEQLGVGEQAFLKSWLVDGVTVMSFDGSVVKDAVKPWRIYFFYHADFFGFHIRFQEIARGGLRTVVPRNKDVEAQDRQNIFRECYDLAFTQELKNKDIPEGGSKGVIFVPFEHKDKIEQYQKMYINAFLEVLKETKECIFFGPDERMSDSMLNWIGKRALESGYPLGAALISSRPENGINHKQYGVTSFGLMVYVDELFSKPMRVKISGGPDGDVAGNAIKLLAERDAVIVAIKDVSGILYDPEGISYKALLPLVEKSLPVASVDCSLLHEGGFLLDMQNGVEMVRKGIREKFDPVAGSSLYDVFLHRVHADLFIPAGGRRASLHLENVSDFMPDGIPSSRVIVEGANVYLTQEARDVLESRGVVIVKDSSANKGGVICSSYEIEVLLTLGEKGLIEHKEQIVQEIYQKITRLCRYEANILRGKKSWSHYSNELSNSIRALSEKILVWLPEWKSPLYKKVIEAHFLPVAARFADGLDRTYRDAVVASFIASRLVYRYGVDLPYKPAFSVLDQMAQEALDFENQHSQ